jgi:hypothetical protein
MIERNPSGTLTMPMVERASFTFKGKLRADEFIAFARHRVCGSHDLVDAFEMACSLGPYECLVLDVVRHAARAA